MTRVTGTTATELAKSELRQIHLVKLDFDSAAVLAHDGIGTYTYAGDTYLGVGQLGSIDVVTEDNTLRPQRVVLSLTGVDNSLVADVLDDDYHLRDALIYLLALDENYQALADPVLIWSGYMDTASIELGEKTATIQMQCMDKLGDLGRPRPCYLTNEAQQRRHSGDLGLEFAPQAVREHKLVWGGVPFNPGSGSGDPPGGGPFVIP